MAFLDATCSKCGKRFGWTGGCLDRPPCPRCKHRPQDAELSADEEAFREMEELLTKRMLGDDGPTR